MLLNDTLSQENLNYSSFMNNDIPPPSFFISKTDHNINMFFKKKVNKYIYISLPDSENKEENKTIEDVSLGFNEDSISENFFNFSSYDPEDEFSNIIDLDESDKFDQNLNINSINQKYTDLVVTANSNSISELKTKINPKKTFAVVYPRKMSLFTNSKIEFDILELNKEIEFVWNKRRRNKEDDIRRMIGRRFFNDIILKLINAILGKAGSLIIFEKIQQDVVYDLVKKSNKKMLNKTLKQIFIEKELYRENNLEKYNHNLKLIKLIKSDEYKNIRENTQIDKILEMKYYDLFQEYLSSNEFIEEINRLKNNKKFDKSYIVKYIYYSLHFIENFFD